MGKFANTIRNIIGIIIGFLLAHLGYKLCIIADKITEMNELVRSLHEIIKNIKFSLF